MGYPVSFTQMSYFVALEEHRNYARAANACSVSQPTLSSQIQKMEDSLGVTLIDRSAQPLELTIIGLRVLGQIKTILIETIELNKIIGAYVLPLKGSLRIGWVSLDQPSWLGESLVRFVEFNPGVHIEIVDIHASFSDENIQDLNLDAIVSSGYLKTMDNNSDNFLSKESSFILIPENHELLGHETVTVSEIRNSGEVLLTVHAQRKTILIENGFKCNPKNLNLANGHWNTAIIASRRGLGMLFLPESDMYRLSFDEKNRCRPIEIKDYSFQWLVEFFPSENLLALKAFLISFKKLSINS